MEVADEIEATTAFAGMAVVARSTQLGSVISFAQETGMGACGAHYSGA